MSANLPGGFNPRDPFASKPGGVYDPGTLNALYLRAQRGDLNARKYLQGLGVLGNQGQDVFAPSDVRAGNYAPAIQQWATQTKSTPYSGQGFQWNQNWTAGDPTFQKAWGDWFSGAGGAYDQQQQKAPPPNQGPSTQATNPAAASLGTFNPWQNYNTPQDSAGWNYTQDPNFNAAADRPKWDLAQTGPASETDRSRVWRWVQEALGTDPGKAPQAAVQQAYLAAIARLRQDYNAPENANKGGWASSPYAGYDKYLPPAGQPGTPGAPGQSPPAPAGAPGVPPAPGAPGAPVPGAPPPTTYVDPVTGQTKTYTGNLDPTQLARNIALSDPQNQDARLSYIMRQYGIDPTRGGLYTSSIARALAPQIEASNQLNGLFGDTNAIDTAQSNLDSLAHSLAGPGGFAAQQARARGILSDPRLGTLTGGLTDPQTIDTLQTILSEAYAGANPIYNQSRLGYFNQALGPGGAYGQYSLDHPQTGAPGYQHPLQWLAGTPWASLLQGY